MSGPKKSVYRADNRISEMIAGQLRCEQQILTCASQTESALKVLLTSTSALEGQIANIQLLEKRTGKGYNQAERIRQLQEMLIRGAQEIKREFSENTPRVSNDSVVTPKTFADKQAQLKKHQALQLRAQNLLNVLNDARAQNRFNTSQIQKSIIRDLEDSAAGEPVEPDLRFLKRSSNSNIREIQRSIVDDLSGVYSFDASDVTTAPENRFEKRKSALNKKLSTLLDDDSLPSEINNDIKQAILKLQMITETHTLNTFDSITVKGLGKRIAAYQLDREQRQTDFDALAMRYNALCKMAGEGAKRLSLSEEAKRSLDAEITRLEDTLMYRHEQAYISESIDEVMAEMGYDLIGTREVQKRSGKKFRNELFAFHEGTVVNVTFSSDGQISVELGGLAHEDRIPTEDETSVLTRDMETFCGEFAVFERKLRDRGVIVGKRVALSPPSAEYASIINVSDYQREGSNQISEMNVKEVRRKKAARKEMRRDS